ncbi:hypothetical protein CRG98_018851 [Punica granatum]|uniref:Uncharacterized protein ycf33 n=1 Tax=Punica granatum TaxID=22663 RepID=A0A2I0JWS9_PUNGR|nr:hypothetical protein CRG98_018851 [Punica granatum]
MKTLSLQHSPFSLPRHTNSSSKSSAPTAFLRIIWSPSQNSNTFPRTALSGLSSPVTLGRPVKYAPPEEENLNVNVPRECSNGYSRAVVIGTVTVGVAVFLLGVGADEHHGRALALGPEGPLVEEFWDNVRRYALYALTVSTGAIYTILQPIIELLKNPISAILILLILGGGFYIITQVLSAMIGITEFSYDYSY